MSISTSIVTPGMGKQLAVRLFLSIPLSNLYMRIAWKLYVPWAHVTFDDASAGDLEWLVARLLEVEGRTIFPFLLALLVSQTWLPDEFGRVHRLLLFLPCFGLLYLLVNLQMPR